MRDLRKAKGLTLRVLAGPVGVNFTSLSKIENGKLEFGDYPGEGLIRRPAKALDADEHELRLLAEEVPDRSKRRVMERPDAFQKLALLDDEKLDRLRARLDGD